MNKTIPPIKWRAKNMRLQPTPSEAKLHNALIEVFRPFLATVHCQEPVGPYVADFYIAPANIVVEVDGSSHRFRSKHDRRRDTFMENRRIRVIRFSNAEVEADALQVARTVLAECGELPKAEGEIKITKLPPGAARGSKRLKPKSRRHRIDFGDIHL